jgi:hypothetical protein
LELTWQLINVVVLVQLRDYPGLQIPLLLFISMVSQIYLIRIRPYEGGVQNKMRLANECLLSMYLYVKFSLTDINTHPDYRLFSAWMLVSILAFSVIFNLSFVIF